MKLSDIPYIAIIAVAAIMPAKAQNLSTEVVVDRNVSVNLPKSTPLSLLSPKSALTATAPPTPQHTEYSLRSNIDATVARANSPLFTGFAAPDTTRTYLLAAYFPVYRLNVAAGYRIIDTRANRLQATAAFYGTSWKANSTTADGEKNILGHNTFNAGLSWQHTSPDGIMADANASYSLTGVMLPDNYRPADNKSRRNISRTRINADIKGSGNIDWEASARLNSFGVASDVLFPSVAADKATATPGPSELMIGIGGKAAGKGTSHFAIALDADMRHSASAVISSLVLLSAPAHTTQGIIAVSPSYSMNYSGFRLRIGIRADVGLGTGGTVAGVAPDVAAFKQLSAALAIYGKVTGGRDFNTLNQLFSYSVYAPCAVSGALRRTPVDARAGIRLFLPKGLKADVFARYAATRCAMRPASMSANAADIAFMAPANVSGWQAGVDISWHDELPVEIHAGARLNAAGAASGFNDIPDGAKAILNAGASVCVGTNISIRTDYSLRACRRYLLLSDESAADAAMPNLSDLSAGATWRLNPRLNIFVSIENILCRRQYLLPGLPSARLSGLLGAAYRF